MDTPHDFILENKFATYEMNTNSPGIYGLAKCHNDLSEDESGNKLTKCIPAPGGSVYLDGCFLHIEKNWSIYICGAPTDITNDQYMKRDFAARVNRAIQNVTTMSVVNNGFGATAVKSGLLAIYALGQCWSYLQQEMCTKCLNNAGDMLRKCLPAAEGNAGFYMRYSSNKFFDDGALELADKGPPKCKNVWLIAVLVLSSILGVFAILGDFVGYRRYSKEKEGTKRDHKIPLALERSKLNFKYEMLEKATGYFDPSNKVGQGGSGSVKGLSYNTRQWEEEFFNEVNLISGTQHKNFVKLLGCSIEGPESLLVFDYVSYRNLDQVLFERFEIILGIAEGLAYLHEGSKAKIIHRDIKNSNVLVDDNLHPQLADFGLARRFAPHKTHVSNGVAGTLGYLAPEYLLQRLVAIEVACCRKSNVFVCNSGSILHLNYKLNKITEPIDSRLMSDFQEQEASRVLQLGLLKEDTEFPVPMQPPFQNSEWYSITNDGFNSEWYSTDGISVFASLSSSQLGDFSMSENSRLLKIS
ncbi:unnamed protein product [Withania somnifera]